MILNRKLWFSQKYLLQACVEIQKYQIKKKKKEKMISVDKLNNASSEYQYALHAYLCNIECHSPKFTAVH
jgi:ribosome recycling factor